LTVYRDESTSHIELPFTARLGAAFIGRLGDDLFGDFILRARKDELERFMAGRTQSPLSAELC
jgi:hypothetical protein